MKRVLFWLLSLTLPVCSFPQNGKLTVMTFNIRYDSPDDGIYSWKNRMPMVFHVLHEEKPDLAGFQEALKNQVDDLSGALKDYSWSGVGRDDGREKGEYAVVFYRKGRFWKMDGGTFWLSETPDVAGSRSWNSACNRIVTWVKLKDLPTDKVLFFFNTHFDHVSSLAREKSAVLLTDRVARIAGNQEVFATGDFNEMRGSKMYEILTTGPKQLKNTEDMAVEHHLNPDYTFIGFPFHPTPGEACDFIFCRNLETWRVLQYRVVTYNIDGKYPSDHLPVVTKFIRGK
jgi:endonuclease/exonuclease/phosphatase family metal-dependent hydrolase